MNRVNLSRRNADRVGRDATMQTNASPESTGKSPQSQSRQPQSQFQWTTSTSAQTPSGMPSGAGISSDLLKQALVHFTVYLLGALLIGTMYFNYILLKPLLVPLFWAVVVSVPLHSLKQQLLHLLSREFFRHRGSLRQVVQIFVRVLLKLLLGSLWTIGPMCIGWYFHVLDWLLPGQGDARQQAALNTITEIDSPIASDTHIEGEHLLQEESPRPTPLEEPPRTVDQPTSTSPMSTSPASTASSPRKRLPQTFVHPRLQSVQSQLFVHSSSATSASSLPDILPDPLEQEAARLRTVSLSERIVDAMQNTASFSYFGYLLRSCCLYLIYLLLSSLDLYTHVLMGVLCAMVILLHILYRLFVWFWHRSLAALMYNSGITTFVGAVLDVIGRIVTLGGLAGSAWHSVSGSGVRAVRRQSRRVSSRSRKWISNNLNSLITVFIIAGFVNFTIGTGAVLVFKIGQEANALFEMGFSFVNETIANSPRIIDDPELLTKIQSSIMDGRSQLLKWGDDKLAEAVPGLNMTVLDVYSRLYESYTLMKDEGLFFPSRKNESTRDFPRVKRLLNGLAQGNLSTALDPTLILESITEIRHALKLATFFDKSTTNRTLSSQIGHVLTKGGSGIVTLLTHLLLSAVTGFTYALNLFLYLLFFLFTLYYLTLNDHSPVHYLSRLLVLVDQHHQFRRAVERSIKAILLSTAQLASFHFLFTWLTLSIANVDFVYCTSVAGALMAVVPVISPFWVILPALVQLMAQQAYWTAALVGWSHLMVVIVVDTAIYSDIPDSHHYVAGYSVVLGLWAFGPEGLVLGPILACLPAIAYHLFWNLALS